MPVHKRPAPWCRVRAVWDGMGLSSSLHTTTRLHPSAHCLSGVAQLLACPLGCEMTSQLCQLCSAAAQPMPAAVHASMLMGVCQGWRCRSRTGTPSWCLGAAHGGWGSPKHGAQCCEGCPQLAAGWSSRLSPVHPSKHLLPINQELMVDCLRGSSSSQMFFPEGLLACLVIREDCGYGELPALQSPLLSCLGGS